MTRLLESRGDAPQMGARCDSEEHCITCGDAAEPLRVVKIDDERGLALCEHRMGARETVEIALVGPVAVGDELLVHAGTAIAHLGVPAISQPGGGEL